MYRHFEDELEDIKNSVLKMSTYVMEAIDKSIEALKNRDVVLANKIIEKDNVIDEMEIIIDEKCEEIILRHHPLASDLRFVLATLKLNNDLERIADLAVDIAEKVVEISDKPLLKPLIDIPRLAELVKTMLRNSVEAFTNKNYELAKKVIMADPEVDKLRDAITIEIIEKYIKPDGSSAERGIPLILVARYLERMGDHCVNIAEDIIYMVSAKIVKHRHEEF